MLIKLLINATVILANFWIWKIFKFDIFLSLLLIFLSLLFFFLSMRKLNRKIFLIFLVLFLITSYRLLNVGFDIHLRVLTPDQQKPLGDRHIYLANNLGILFKNRVSLRFFRDAYPYINNYSANAFSALSPNLYFFTSHPRERAGVNEFLMYPSILVIPFLIGLVNLIKFINIFVVFYISIAFILQGFISQSYNFGPILFFPIINLLITNGLVKIIQMFKK